MSVSSFSCGGVLGTMTVISPASSTGLVVVDFDNRPTLIASRDRPNVSFSWSTDRDSITFVYQGVTGGKGAFSAEIPDYPQSHIEGAGGAGTDNPSDNRRSG